MNKPSVSFFLSFFFLMTALTFPLLGSSRVEAIEAREEQKIEEQIKELSEEWQEKFVEAVKSFLDQELQRLKKDKEEPPESLKQRIENYEASIAQGTEDPETFFALGKLYDQMGDGASAIIITRRAERVFEKEKNVKGVAEARRNLRIFYEKYQYRPGDFEL